MKVILPEYKCAHVMIVGDIMLDRYWFGKTNRISQEAPVPVVQINNILERPGGAANVAMNIASLGAHAHLVGLIGIDNAAKTLRKALNHVNITCNFVTIPNHSTVVKLRVFSHNQQLIRLDFDEVFKNIDLEKLQTCINQSLKYVNVLVLSDYAKGTLVNVEKMIETANKAGISVIVDPKGVDFERYRGSVLLKPNFSEFEAVVGQCNNKKEVIDRGMKLIFDCEISAMLITHSEQGMTLLQLDKEPLHMPAQAKEVYDVTGAGDTVIAVLAATLSAGSTLEEACYVANIAAGEVIGKLGTSSISFFELENAIFDHSKINFGIMTKEELKIAVTAAQKRGEKVVMTNGVFDILHAGHVFYLENARKLGDRLVVAVNSDDSAKRLKGKNRPVNSLEQRMAVLNALESVDWVVSFEEDTPKDLITLILPDFLVKGEDYKFKHISGSEEIWNNGGEVVTIRLKNGCSTTNIIQKIQKKTGENKNF